MFTEREQRNETEICIHESYLQLDISYDHNQVREAKHRKGDERPYTRKRP